MLYLFKGTSPRLSDFRLYALVAALSALGSLAGVLLGLGPVANGGDEFAYLLGGQTFAAGRLTNPTHPYWKFFETYHVLAQPTYMAKYPPGQSLVLALGYKLGNPIFGVWLSGMTFALATAWMVRARLARRWALLGGIFTILQFGATHYYTQSYWGGAVAATAGALIIGATLRLARTPSRAAAAWLGVGAAVGLLSRPFETCLLCVAPGLLVLQRLGRTHPARRRYAVNLLLVSAPIVGAALLFQAILNQAITGDWWRLPYTTYEKQYSGTPFFVWQAARTTPVFNNEVMALFHRYFIVATTRFESAVPLVWLQRLYDTSVSSLGPLLGLAAVLGSAFYPTRTVRFLWLVVGISSLGFVATYWYLSHYYAGLHGLWFLLGIHGLRAGFLLTRARRLPFALAAIAVIGMCTAVRISADIKLKPYVDSLGFARQKIQRQLVEIGGDHLVFVRRFRPFNFHFIWVHNEADIDGSHVIWAHDRGPEENRQLIDYYHGKRRLWLLTEGNDQPRLQPFEATADSPASK
jgi:hypothetical protein